DSPAGSSALHEVQEPSLAPQRGEHRAQRLVGIVDELIQHTAPATCGELGELAVSVDVLEPGAVLPHGAHLVGYRTVDRPEEAFDGLSFRAMSVEVGREEQVRVLQRQLGRRMTPDLTAMEDRQPCVVGAGDVAHRAADTSGP